MPRDTHGARRRRAILDAAADLSTSEGLESLSFGRLASEVGLTKPGVAAHFDSKQAMQLAVVEAAAAAYADPLSAARETAAPGLGRLRALCRAWLDHLDGVSYRGGCFFSAAGHDFSGRPGPVRDALAQHTRRFIAELDEQATLALRLGEVSSDTDPVALAFSLHALALEANLRRELLDDDDSFSLAHRALEELLARVTAAPKEETRS